MRTASKLLLLCAAAIAAMALAATSASAQETGIHVQNEDTGAACDGTNCTVIAEGEGLIQRESDGAVRSNCEDTFEATINNEAGDGTIDWAGVTHPNGNCNVRDCGSPEDQWPMHTGGETGPNEGHMLVDFCLENRFTFVETHCLNTEVHVEETGLHHYTFTLPATHCDDKIISGQWTTHENVEGHDDIEIIHESA